MDKPTIDSIDFSDTEISIIYYEPYYNSSVLSKYEIIIHMNTYEIELYMYFQNDTFKSKVYSTEGEFNKDIFNQFAKHYPELAMKIRVRSLIDE